MDPLNKALKPLKEAARSFFRDDVRLRLRDGRVQFELEAPPHPGVARAAVSDAERRERDLLQSIRLQLAEVLDELPLLRDDHKHLAFLEQALAVQGLSAIERAPPQALERALVQLEGLVSNWAPVGLATLRSKMAVAVRARRRANGDTTSAGD